MKKRSIMLTKPVRDEFVIADDITLHVVQWGEQGPPVICVHGLTANAFCFQAIADDLARDHRVFAYDLRGRGDSDKPEEGYSVPLHTEDLAALIKELRLERPVVLGHSLGALVSLYFAAHYPKALSKLILIDAGAPLPWKTPEEQPAWLTLSISRLGTPVPSFQEYIERLKLAPFLSPWNEYFDLYFQHDVRVNSDGSVVSKCYRQGVLEEAMRFGEAEAEQQWPKVEVPTLLLRAGQGMFADNDQLLPETSAEQMLKAIKHCRYVNYPMLNHYTIIFNAQAGPAQEIRTFLEKE
jgi:pimeloyl-ACP methyl ester carboxylesterase